MAIGLLRQISARSIQTHSPSPRALPVQLLLPLMRVVLTCRVGHINVTPSTTVSVGFMTSQHCPRQDACIPHVTAATVVESCDRFPEIACCLYMFLLLSEPRFSCHFIPSRPVPALSLPYFMSFVLCVLIELDSNRRSPIRPFHSFAVDGVFTICLITWHICTTLYDMT